MIDEVLSSYLTHYQRRRLAEESSGGPLSEAHFEAAVLFADIAGFTDLTERLAQQGSVGAERLAGIISESFGSVSRTITAAGGDVLFFAGDSLWALWPCPLIGSLRRSVALAAGAALEVQAGFAGADGLRLRTSVAVGGVDFRDLGGRRRQRLTLFSGQGLDEAARVDAAASPGRVFLSPAAFRAGDGLLRGDRLPDGNWTVDSVDVQLQRALWSPPTVEERLAESYLPPVVIERTRAGLGNWLAEFRTVTVVFVRRSQGTGDEFQATADAVQQTVHEHGGEVYQFLCDEKGQITVAAFGLPLSTHEDSAARAVSAAVELSAGLAAEGIGVATGQLFCGTYGTRRRRQYTLAGTAMNRAARLMQPGGVLCDSATVSLATRHGWEFEKRGPVVARGMTEPVPVWRPIQRSRRQLSNQLGSQVLVGRSEEISRLRRFLRSPRRGQASGLVVRGPAGAGKTALVHWLLAEASGDGQRCLGVAGRSIDQAAPYFVWRQLVEAIVAPGAEQVGTDALIGEMLAAAGGDLRRYRGLLNLVAPLGLPTDELAAGLPDAVRAEKIADLLLALVRGWAGAGRALIVFEDGHWFDSSSVEVIGRLSEEVAGIQVVVSTRPNDTGGELPVDRLAPPLFEQLEVGPLERSGIDALARQILGVGAVDDQLLEFLEAKTAGNPLYCRELVALLRERRDLRVEDDVCRLRQVAEAGAAQLDETLVRHGLPDSLQGLVAARLDRLEAKQQLVMRVASVIGPTFSLGQLSAVYPTPAPAADLERQLSALVDRELIRHEGGERYGFGHALTQQAAYNSVPFDLRRDLHRRLAEKLERERAGDEAIYQLAHHWKRTGDEASAMTYLARAGLHALETYSHREAVELLGQALQLHRQVGRDLTRRRSWELALGKAYVNWSRFELGAKHLYRGLSRDAAGSPPGQLGAAAGLAAEIARQTAHAWLPGLLTGRLNQLHQTPDAVPALESLVEAHYLLDQPIHCVRAAFATLNRAERAGPSARLAKAYVSIGALLGFIPLHSLARRYCDKARRAAVEAADPAGIGWVALGTGMYEAGLGQWERASNHLKRAAVEFGRLGDGRRWEDCQLNLAAILYLQGRLDECRIVCEGHYTSAAARSDVRSRCEALRRKLFCLWMTAEVEEFDAALSEYERLVRGETRSRDNRDQSTLFVLKGLNAVRAGRLEEAGSLARRGAELLHESTPNSFDMILDCGASAALMLGLAQAAGDSGSLRREARAGCRKLRSIKRVFPICEPLYFLHLGRYRALTRRTAAARRAWKRSMGAARRLEMPLYAAAAALHLGDSREAVERGQQFRAPAEAASFEVAG